jgi:subfamily B ATP-binding cassette protein MsbA
VGKKYKGPPVKLNDGWGTYRRLLTYVKGYWFIFVIAIVSSAAYSAVDAGMIKFVQPLIDQAFVKRDPLLIAWIPIIIPVAFVLRGGMNFVSNYSMTWLAREVVTLMRQQLFSHFQYLPARFYDRNTSGQLLAKILYNVDQVAGAATDAVTESVRHICLILFLLGVMIWTHWQLTALFLTVGPIMVLLFAYASKRFRALSHRTQHAIGDMSHVVEENIEGYKVVRTFGAQEYEINQFIAEADRTRSLQLKMAFTKGLSDPIIQLVGGCALAMTIYLATSGFGAGEALTAGEFASLMAAMMGLLNPLKQLSTLNGKVQQGLAGAESIFVLLDEPVEVDLGQVTMKRAQGKIRFSNVNFSYENSPQEILKNINLEIESGQRIALVGRSGSGKTTLVNLLPHFYDNYSGMISLDGHDIRELKLKDLRQQFSYVSQHVTLFNDTIANNIAYGRLHEVTQEEIIAAAKAAQAFEFIEKLPAGFDTVIGENGILLSGGQRQRLAIARALCKNAPILILDEATSALDTESERLLQVALENLMQGRTTIIIAHRLSTIENVDEIVVMENGHIIEQGTHLELLQSNGHYARLQSMQSVDSIMEESLTN